MGRFNPNEYVDVATRIRRFYAEHPEGRIVTELVHYKEGDIVFRAEVWRDREAPPEKPDAVGWAHEVVGKGHVNETSALENCETSAIGRALANLGFPVKEGEPRPSREEMQGAQRRREANGKPATDEQLDRISALLDERDIPADKRERTLAEVAAGITAERAAKCITWLESLPTKDRAA